MDSLPELPLSVSMNDEPTTVRMTGTDAVENPGPACAQQRVLQSISGNLGDSAGSLDSSESMVETSLEPTKKGSLASVAKEPSEIAPLGFEPRLFGIKNRRVANYTIPQHEIKEVLSTL